MASLYMPDLVGSFNQGYDRGQSQRFNQLAGQAIADPSTASQNLGLAASINPGKALAVQQEVQSSQDARQKKLAGAANYVLSAYRSGNPQQLEGAYQAVRPFLNQLGQELGQGEAAPHFTEEMLPHLYKIVGEAGGAPGTEPEGVVVAPGGALVDKATGKTLYQADPQVPASVRSLEYLQAHPDLAQFQVDQHQDVIRRQPRSGSPGGSSPKPARAPMGYRWTDSGTLEPIPGGPADKSGRPATTSGGRPPNNEQNNAAGFADRMSAASAELAALEENGYDPTNLRDRTAVGVGGVIGNSALSDKGRQYLQAEQNWVRANLRKESGAAIGKDEMEKEIATYFPVAGDDPGTVAQKARSREITQAAVARAAGPALRGGAPAASPSPASNGARGGAGGGAHAVGDVLTVNGRQYRVVGGDPNDPDVEPL